MAEYKHARWIPEENSADTVPAVEVCYCRDCKHCIAEKLLCVHPKNKVFGTGISVCLDHFCSYGERKEG